MSTSVQQIQSALKKWESYIGELAMIESTSNYNKAFFELQTNRLVDVCLYLGEIQFDFEEGPNRQYGSLGCISTRKRKDVCFTLEEVRAHAKKRITEDARFADIAENKNDFKIGQKFFVVNELPHTTRVDVNVVTLTNYTVKDGLAFSGKSHYKANENTIYSKEELDEVLDRVEAFASNQLGIPRIVKKIQPALLTFPRFIATIIEDNQKGGVTEETLRFNESTYGTVEEVTANLQKLYGKIRAKAYIIDTKTNELTQWSTH